MYIVFFSKVQDHQEEEAQAMTTISQESNFTGK
jgi:hypothetical protein